MEEVIRRLKQIASQMHQQSRQSIFKDVPLSPPDPIFNLNTAYKMDTFGEKVNVGVGAYRTEEGKPWVLPAVKKAERMIVDDATLDHEYLPIDGLLTFTEASARLILGDDSPAISENRYASVQAISGTGALRLCAQFLQRFKPGTAVVISNPTWGPHRTIFSDAGLAVQEYPYWDAKARGIDFEGMTASINGAPEGSVFVLHACAHNPTGCDPSREQWHELAGLLKAKRHIVVFDCAYQGFASGSLDDDAYAVRHFVQAGLQLFVAQSYSKNFGLYNERCGALVTVCGNSEEARAVRSQLCKLQRALISNPPAFGARIVSRILNDPALHAEWMANLTTMVTRIKAMRRALYEELLRLQTPGRWEHVISQIGMFSYTGLSKAQSTVMKERFHIYLTDNGRISIAGLTSKNIKYFAESMDWVVRNVHD